MKIGSGIYQIRNIKNQKVYIGSAVNLVRREKLHFWFLRKNKHPNKHLQAAYNLYGPDALVFEPLETGISRTSLLEREQHWLDLAKPFMRENGYNVCPTAGNTLNMLHSMETKQILSEIAKKRYQKKENHPWTGRHHSKESKQKMSTSHKGQSLSEETRLKLSSNSPNKGKPRSLEVRAKISATKQAKPFKQTEEAKEKMREAWKLRRAKGCSDLTKQRCAAAAKRRKRTAEGKFV